MAGKTRGKDMKEKEIELERFRTAQGSLVAGTDFPSAPLVDCYRHNKFGARKYDR